MSRRGVLAGGNWVIDHVKVIDLYPEQDSLATILEESWSNGGGPYNVLKDLSRMKAPIPLAGVGLVGDDAYGRYILEDCRKSGIDSSGLCITREATTSYTDVMTVKSTGRRTFFHQRGANALLDASHFNFATTDARIFYLGYLLLLDRLDVLYEDNSTGASRVLYLAKDAGLRTFVDLVSVESDGFYRLVKPALPYVDCIALNEYEAERLSGITMAKGSRVDVDAVVRAARSILEMGVNRLVTIHFPAGALALDVDNKCFRQGSVPVPSQQIKGTVGAGDAFAAGLLYGLHENWPVPECLKLAVCVAASSLYDTSTSGSILPMDECLALGQELGFSPL